MNRILIFTVLSLFLCFGIYSCGDASDQTGEPTEQVESTIRYGQKRIEFPKLSEKTKIQIAQWAVFDDFEMEATTISGSTIEALKVKTERLITHTDSLAKKIPDTLNTNLVASRLMVVGTRTKLLHQEVNRARLDSAKIVDHINEFNIAVVNFLQQLNEKFQKDAIDEQRKDDEKKELEKQKRFLDSVYQAELHDNN
jgi:hypothetical protein